MKRTPALQSLRPQRQDGYLDSLQKGNEDLGGVPSKVFFESLLEATVEGSSAIRPTAATATWWRGR